MHIIVIEKEWFEMELLVAALKKEFPNSVISEFRNAGDFLLAIDTLSTADIIITENLLALCEVRRDHKEWVENLEKLFSDVTVGWNHHEAGKRLVIHMRKSGINTPIIIYTHSEYNWVDSSVWKYPKVTYFQKRGDERIVSHIRKILSVQV